METLEIIGKSFEQWYNTKVFKECPVRIVVNYSDTQKMSIKAFHTAAIELSAVQLTENTSYVIPILKLQENYNHGITSEQEAKDAITKKFLMAVFDYIKAI